MPVAAPRQSRPPSKRPHGPRDDADDRPAKVARSSNNGYSSSSTFTSTLPSNIFDSDDDDRHGNGESFPAGESVGNPPHHERFHQLMAQHRAQQARRPPLPDAPPPSLPNPPLPPSSR